MLKKLLLIIVFMLFGILAKAQQKLHYKITSNDMEIGNLTISKTKNNANTIYDVTSDSHFKLFITIDLSYKLNAVYQNNELIFSSVTTYVNGKQHNTATTEKKEDHLYILKNNGHETRSYQSITYSGVLLYFKEPINIKEVYSEFYTAFNPIQKIGTHKYQLTNSENGNTSEYYYLNGILQKASIHHTLMTFHLELINP